MNSMTGYGQYQLKSEMVDLSINIRSVNGRFLDFRFHLPREYAAYESALKTLLLEYFRRGTVDVYIHRKASGAGSGAQVRVREELARKWLKAYQGLARELKLQADASMDVVLQAPEVLYIEEAPTISPKERTVLFEAVATAAAACLKEKEREGRSLRQDLSQNLKQLEQIARKMRELRKLADQDAQSRLSERLNRWRELQDLDPQRFAQELALQLDRGDISEELVRLEEHLKICRQLMLSKDAQGKKLDFYAQELLREVNTIGSKSQIAPLTQEVVEAKTVIERVREQVQNIE